MESEELKAISYIRRCLLRKNQKIRDLIEKVGNLEQRLETAESENSRMKEYEWRCTDLEKEVHQLQEELRLDMSDALVHRKHTYDDVKQQKHSRTKQHVFGSQSNGVALCKQENASSSSSCSNLTAGHGGENEETHTETLCEEENIEHKNEILTYKYAQSSGAVFPYVESASENFVMDFSADAHCDSDCNIPGDNIASLHVSSSNSTIGSKDPGSRVTRITSATGELPSASLSLPSASPSEPNIHTFDSQRSPSHRKHASSSSTDMPSVSNQVSASPGYCVDANTRNSTTDASTSPAAAKIPRTFVDGPTSKPAPAPQAYRFDDGSAAFSCHVCRAWFCDRATLANHLKSHKGARGPYACMVPGCASTFTSHRNVDMHMQMVHLKIQRYACSRCEYKSAKKQNVARHLLGRHGKDVAARVIDLDTTLADQSR